jgi:hypothetical protein
LWAYDTNSTTFFRETWSGSGDLMNGNCAHPTFVGNPAKHPGDRHPYHQMTYDAKRGRLWIYSGVADSGKCDGSGPGLCNYVDLWYYDSRTNSWTCADTGGGCNSDSTKQFSPGRRVEGAIAYDEGNDVVVFFGSLKGGSQTNDTWQYSPSTNKWDRVLENGVSGVPAPRNGDTMVYDGVDQKTVLFGGTAASGGKLQVMNDVWLYDAKKKKWIDPKPPNAPPGAKFPAVAYDSNRNLVVYYSGPDGLWAYSIPGNRWSNLHVQGGPEIEVPNSISMVYDPSSDLYVLFNAVRRQLWQLKGAGIDSRAATQ